MANKKEAPEKHSIPKNTVVLRPKPPDSVPPENTRDSTLNGQMVDVIDHQLSIHIPNSDGAWSDPQKSIRIRMGTI